VRENLAGFSANPPVTRSGSQRRTPDNYELFSTDTSQLIEEALQRETGRSPPQGN
jgi:hypothetical protein